MLLPVPNVRGRVFADPSSSEAVVIMGKSSRVCGRSCSTLVRGFPAGEALWGAASLKERDRGSGSKRGRISRAGTHWASSWAARRLQPSRRDVGTGHSLWAEGLMLRERLRATDSEPSTATKKLLAR